MPHRKIVYLDFDGVLHATSLVTEGLFSRVHLLEPLFEDGLAGIVISSSWRFTHSLSSLQAKLPSTLAKCVIGMTGDAIIGKHARYQEIIHHTKGLEPCTSWCALDDSYWEFPSDCKELIRCNPNTGVGPKEVAQLTVWLRN
jgi:HAD domain in Swiss Army Knife RNA repair proteins